VARKIARFSPAVDAILDFGVERTANALTAAWPQHKKVCKSLNEPWPVCRMRQTPRNAIALPGSITGYPKQKEVLVLLPVGSFENEKDRRQCRSHFGDDAQYAASILSALQYFFKEERSGGARFTQEDISNMCYE
jgi:hypothetical protein